MHKLFNLLFATLAVLAVATACDDNNTGSSVLDSEAQLIVDSSFTVQAYSVSNEKIQSRTLTQLLGSIRSADYGELRSDFVTEFMPASVMDTTGVGISDIDSINIAFQVPMGSYTGDSITPMKVNVYRLKKNLPYPIYSDFNPQEYYDKSDLLGSKAYAMTTLDQDSALYYQYDSQGNQQVFQLIVVGLPKSLGTEFYKEYKTNPEIFKDPTAFSKFFPGIYATTSFGNGRVVKITNTTMNMFYKKHDKTEEGNDTVYTQSNSYFGVSPEVVTNNNIVLQPSESIKKMVDEGTPVVIAPAGYNVQIKIPFREMADKFDAIGKEGQAVANSVTMTLHASQIKNSYGIKPPTYLLLVKESEKDAFFKDNKLPDDESSFYAEYDSTSGTYEFSGLRSFLKKVIDGELSAEDNIEDFLLIPVDMEFETTSNSYYTSSQTVLKKVAPQVSAPAMVAIDLEKTKIVATYSKKDFNK